MKIEQIKTLPRQYGLAGFLGKLPLGAVKAHGWLGHQLDLMVNGMVGRLPEVSSHLGPSNGWFDTSATHEFSGWEEQPYWLRGYYPLGVLTNDQRILAEARRWIDAVLASQDSDGYFGQKYHKAVRCRNGKIVADLWGHMLMLDVLIQHYEYTQDDRILPFMERFFCFCRDLPNESFVPVITEEYGNWTPSIQRQRAGDMIPHLHWLYKRTGQDWLLDLATRFYRRISPPHDEFLDRHVVNFTQRFAYPALYGAQTGDPSYLQATHYWMQQHLGVWGQQPRGIFGADECTRSGKTDPRQAFETCAMVEFCKSFYLLSRVTGDPLFGDLAEDILFNHFPASQTPDLKALHYLTASNLPQLDAGSHDFHNSGRMVDYSPYLYRCCQHNVAMGWPWFVQNLWQSTSDGGICAWMYASSEACCQPGGSDTAVLRMDTDYPFKEEIHITIKEVSAASRFPLYLRVPGWCPSGCVKLNGRHLDIPMEPRSFLRIDNNWSPGDKVAVQFDAKPSLRLWPRTGSVTLERGPLSYSVRIRERWKEFTGGANNSEWPEWEVFPESPWNYGLVMENNNCVIREYRTRETVAAQPWTVEDAPAEFVLLAKQIPGWRLDENQTVQELQPSPIRSDAPAEEIVMIPLGCARLRMSCLPRVTETRDAQPWG